MSQSEDEQRRQIAGLYDEAAAAMQQGDWATALANLEQVGAFDPQFPGLAWRRRETQRRLEIGRRYERARLLMYGERWLEASLILKQIRREAGDYVQTNLLIDVSERYRRNAHLPPPSMPWWIFFVERKQVIGTMAVAAGITLFAVGSWVELSSQAPGSAVAYATAAPTIEVAQLPDTPTPTAVEPLFTPDATLPAEQPTVTPAESTVEAASPTLSANATGAATPTESGSVPDNATPSRPATQAPSARSTAVAIVPPRTTTARPVPMPTAGAGVLIINTDTPPPAAPTFTPTRVVSANPRQLNVVATDFLFDPNSVIFNAGERVRLTLTNNGSVDHAWVLSDLGGREIVRVLAHPGQSASLVFDVPPAGIYTITSELGERAAQGMAGTATVR